MNIWTEKSIELATQRDYLDRLLKIYPIIENSEREIDEEVWGNIQKHFNNSDKHALIKILLNKSKVPTFPVKDSYVAFLKEDKTALLRNPKTVERLFNRIHKLSLDELHSAIKKPIEPNRQNGSSFKNWLKQGNLGVTLTDTERDFFNPDNERTIFIGSDEKIKTIAGEFLGYSGEKGLDFLAKFSDKFILGEAKFLSSFGGNQNNQLDTAETILHKITRETDKTVIPILILDGVLYLNKKNKLCKYVRNRSNTEVILSSVLLREYLFSL